MYVIHFSVSKTKVVAKLVLAEDISHFYFAYGIFSCLLPMLKLNCYINTLDHVPTLL